MKVWEVPGYIAAAEWYHRWVQRVILLEDQCNTCDRPDSMKHKLMLSEQDIAAKLPVHLLAAIPRRNWVDPPHRYCN